MWYFNATVFIFGLNQNLSNMKKVFIVFFPCLLFSCFTPKQAATNNPRIPAKFDFTPPSREKAGSSTMTIALIKPVYVKEDAEYYVQPFSEMASNMGNDFEEMLTAKGFTIRGPFASHDAMLFNDKQNSSFALLVEIDLQPNYNRKYKFVQGWGVISPSHYKMTGEVTLGGSLVITAISSKYSEKIWKKNIALDKSVFSYTGSLKWDNVPTVASELKQDPEFYNSLARELEKFYAKSMQLAWQQIDPAEMLTVAEQAKKADSRQQ